MGSSGDFETDPALGPRFCPRCGREGPEGKDLCPECGERTIRRGYCPTCEATWPLPVGVPCPKHDLDLEPEPREGPRRLHDGPAPALVTVGTFADALKAEAPRIRLEAEGIPTFLEGERMGGRSMYLVATGGVKLQVPETLEADARVLLGQTWKPSAAPDDLDDAWDELAPDPGSVRRAVMKGVILFLVFAPPLIVLFLPLARLINDRPARLGVRAGRPATGPGSSGAPARGRGSRGSRRE